MICARNNRCEVWCRLGKQAALHYVQKLVAEWTVCKANAGKLNDKPTSASQSEAQVHGTALSNSDLVCVANLNLPVKGLVTEHTDTAATPSTSAALEESDTDSAVVAMRSEHATLHSVKETAADASLADKESEVRDMCETMWCTLRLDIVKCAIHPYQTFAELASAAGLAWICTEIFHAEWEVCQLMKQSSLQPHIHACCDA